MMEDRVAQPAKKSTPRAKKVPAPARTATRGRARTAAAPAAEVEVQAVETAQATTSRTRPPRPSTQRPAALAAAALRGETVDAEVAAAQEADVDGPVTEDTAEQQAERDARLEALREETATSVFKGRRLTVRLPSDEQLVMYRRLSRDFQDIAAKGGTDGMELDEALRHMDRAVRLVQSILVEERDKEWVEDQLLEGRINLQECTSILRDAMRALNTRHEELAAAVTNRAGRRANRSRARLADG